jgi:arylformamidase
VTLDREALGRAYSPSSIAPDFAQTLQKYASLSEAARTALGAGQVLRYGASERESVTLYAAPGASAPLLVFFHGGYWQEGSTRDSVFPAPALRQAGISYAAVGYSLSPQASLSAIVGQCAAALLLLVRLYREQRPGARVVLSGSSAGAHLAAMMMTVDWSEHGFAGAPFSAAVLLSGVYDLRPLVPTYINDALRLDAAQALAMSPMFLPLPATVPCALCWGEREPDEFRLQSQRFAAWLRQEGGSATLCEVATRDHFDIVFDLADPYTVLGREVRTRLEK